MKRALPVLTLHLLASCALGQSMFRVLPPDFNADKTRQMMRSHLRTAVHESLDRRLNELENALSAPEELAAYRKKRRQFLEERFDVFPELPPPTARITGTIREDGFVIEKLLIESRPGYYLTANLYLPGGPAPFPAILHPPGHAANGKAYDAYQKANRLLVRNGFAVLCFDPLGQGERKQVIGPEKLTRSASGEHQLLGVAPILLGQGLGAHMVHDAVRCLDYLCARPEVDPERIGCTGNSGGGNLTSYLAAFDDRIRAAAPGCFMTTHRLKNERPGPGDAEQNLFDQIRWGFDHPDFLIARAPQPILILSATRDFVPIEGTWRAFRQAKRVYTALGFPERIDLLEVDARHGFDRTMREGAVRFFARWLQGRSIEVFEEANAAVRTEQELHVTPDGQVLKISGSRSLFDLFAEEESGLAGRRPELTRELVRTTTGIRRLEAIPKPRTETVGEGRPTRMIFHPEPGIVLPALHWERGDQQPVVLFPDGGMNAAVEEAESWNAKGHPVLVVEARDTGETRTRNWRFFGADYYIAHMLGRCWLGAWSEDMLSASRWMANRCEARSVRLEASGELTPAARHAAALEPELISGLDLDGGLRSWKELMTARDADRHLHNAVWGALRTYDLPDLKTLK